MCLMKLLRTNFTENFLCLCKQFSVFMITSLLSKYFNHLPSLWLSYFCKVFKDNRNIQTQLILFCEDFHAQYAVPSKDL